MKSKAISLLMLLFSTLSYATGNEKGNGLEDGITVMPQDVFEYTCKLKLTKFQNSSKGYKLGKIEATVVYNNKKTGSVGKVNWKEVQDNGLKNNWNINSDGIFFSLLEFNKESNTMLFLASVSELSIAGSTMITDRSYFETKFDNFSEFGTEAMTTEEILPTIEPINSVRSNVSTLQANCLRTK